MLTKVCEYCKESFAKPPTCGLPEWGRRRFCSRECKRLSQVGKAPWNKGLHGPSKAKKIPCRICGKPTKYSGTSRCKLYGQVHCGSDSCANESREMKNQRISEKAVEMYSNGERQKITHTWDNVKRVSNEELTITPFMASLGWIPQYKFLTGVHTNKLPRMFRLDFALPDHQLYVEIDGSVHRLRKDRDARRDQMMSERGWIGLRISAESVRNNPDDVMTEITQWANRQLNNAN